MATLLSGCRWAGEQSRLQPGSSPGLNEASKTCGKQCPERLAFFAEMSLGLLVGIRCLGLPNDWKLHRLNLLGTPWVFPESTHGATLLPPSKMFLSSLSKPQLGRPRPRRRSRSRVLLLLGNSCVLTVTVTGASGWVAQAVASHHLGYDEDSPNSARCLFSNQLAVPVQ